jgi:hypothetical protein
MRRSPTGLRRWRKTSRPGGPGGDGWSADPQREADSAIVGGFS